MRTYIYTQYMVHNEYEYENAKMIIIHAIYIIYKI